MARNEEAGQSEVPADAIVPRDLPEIVRTYRRPRILDFGCGYGRSIAPLLSAGHDVWGVDVADDQLAKARAVLAEHGLDAGRVGRLGPDGRAPHADGSIDVLFTNQVLEHVEDLDAVAAEVARLLSPGGTSIHEWPGRWRAVEPHLRMPFLHWLPKNRIRRLAITLWRSLRVGSPWPPELDPTSGRAARIEFDYWYSTKQTFYRSPRTVEDAFRKYGLQTRWARHPRVQRLPRVLQPLALLVIRSVREVRLVAEKPGPT